MDQNSIYISIADYSRENGGELQGQPDVFDLPETEATELFVNPFLCYNANPLQWEEIQEVARNAEKEGRDPEEVLRWVRAGPSESAVIYLTPLQLEAVVEELKSIGPAADVITLEACAFYLTDCLYRARVANNRAPLKPRWFYFSIDNFVSLFIYCFYNTNFRAEIYKDLRTDAITNDLRFFFFS